VATSAKLPLFTPFWNWPETKPLPSVKPHPFVGSMILATPGFSNAKQICTPPIPTPLPSTSCARNPVTLLPSAVTAFGAERLKQLPPPFWPSGEHDWLVNWPKAALPVLVPPPVLPQEE
jgi:hypothetical protein